jgi:uncharacterized membrane protein YkvA (DUF1232 family)
MSEIQRYDPPSSPEEQAITIRNLFDRALLTWRLLWDKRVGFLPKLIPLVGLAYIISPIDFIPAFLTGPLGVLDDVGAAGLILLTLGLFIQMSPPDVVREHLRELGASGAHLDDELDSSAAQPTGDVIDSTAEVIED